MTTATKTKITIKENAWGNWYGYIGGRKVEWFCDDLDGTQEQNANAWLIRERMKQQDATDDREYAEASALGIFGDGGFPDAPEPDDDIDNSNFDLGGEA